MHYFLPINWIVQHRIDFVCFQVGGLQIKFIRHSADRRAVGIVCIHLATLQASKFQNITTKQKWLLQRIIVAFAANSMKLLSS